MKITMVAVISEDGYLTNGTNPNPGDWSSEEDKNWYNETLKAYNLYILGSRTYELAKYTLPVHAHKIVMSHKAHEQPSTPGVTFSSKSFKDIIHSFSKNYSQMLVLGGSSVYHQMLEQKLIDDALVTVEPIMLHSGIQLAPNKKYFEDLGFVLVSEKHLNDKGTILKHYILKK